MTDQAVATPSTTLVQGQTTPAPAADPSIQPRPVTTPTPDPSAQQTPAAPGVSSPAPATPPATPPADPNAEQTVPIARVNKLTQEKWEARRRAQALEAENMELRRQAAAQQQPPPADPNAQVTPSQNPQQPQQPQFTPQQQAAQILFDEKCNQTYRKGLEDTTNTPNFHQALQGFQMFGGLDQFPDVVDAAVNMEDGHKILHHLGTHPDIAEQVLSLPPGARAVKVGEIMAGLRTPAAPVTPPATPPPAAQISQAPAPTEPVRSGVTTEPGPDEQGRFKSQEEYRAWRAKQFTRKR